MTIANISLALGLLATLVVGYAVGSIRRQNRTDELIAEAQKQAEQIRKEKLLAAQEQIQEMREKQENRTKKREQELTEMEERLLRREDRLGKKSSYLEQIGDSLRKDEQQLEELKKAGTSLLEEMQQQLEETAEWDRQQARQHLLELVEAESQRYFSRKIESVERKAREESEQRAANVIASAVQRYAPEYIEDRAVTSIPLPSEEFKGRIIGREGRNIKTFEALTGVDLLVDDTPEMVVLSSFHPLRREVARLALSRLIEDGRIHPAQIEEKVNRAKARLADTVKEEGRKVAFDLGIDLHPELAALVGRLRYRTSFGQNQLSHSQEVSWMAKMIADELGLDSTMAKRAGLLHDIGKAVDHEVDGPHALIGADLARRYGESAEVVQAISAHHEDVDLTGALDVILQAADTLSAARPGARKETFERYTRRLNELEELCRSFPAVEEAYALQAGREVRIMVQPDRANDDAAAKLAYDIARTIEDELSYPGEIKVNVIRKTQFTRNAK